MEQPEVQGGWAVAMSTMSDDGLLLVEMTHRVANEVSSSLAALRLALARSSTAGRVELMSSAMNRLEGFAELLAVLNVPPGGFVKVGPLLQRLCDGICAGRPGAERVMVSVDADGVTLDAGTARCLMMVASELVQNALRHGLDGIGGMIAVVVRRRANSVNFTVVDEGRGLRHPSETVGTGIGGPLISELLRRAGGRVKIESNDRGTTVRVVLPLKAATATIEG